MVINRLVRLVVFGDWRVDYPLARDDVWHGHNWPGGCDVVPLYSLCVDLVRGLRDTTATALCCFSDIGHRRKLGSWTYEHVRRRPGGMEKLFRFSRADRGGASAHRVACVPQKLKLAGPKVKFLRPTLPSVRSNKADGSKHNMSSGSRRSSPTSRSRMKNHPRYVPS